jgi:hypothetical protein
MVDKPDAFFTYMNHHAPRLVRNTANLNYLNSVHGVRFHSARRSIGRELLPVASLNSATLLGAEVVGRSYGGGLLKLEPKEADVLPVPGSDLVEVAADSLRSLRPQLGKHLRGGDLLSAVALVDEVLLVRHGGMSPTDVAQIRDARQVMFDRRAARGGSGVAR